MTYVTPVYDRELVAEDEREMFDRVVARQNALTWKGRPSDETAGPYFGPLMQSPPVSDLLSALGIFYRTRGETNNSYAHADREWVDIVLGTELGSNAVVISHIPDAIAVGVRPEAIRAIRTGQEYELTDAERQLAEFIRAVIHGGVTEELFAGIVERFGTRGAVEYATCVTWLLLTTRTLQALGFGDPTDEQVAELVQQAIDGTAEIPNPRERIPPLDAAKI
jgi:hypothetical protein